jgi:hypothetical protein
LKALTTGAYLEALHERIDNDPELLTDRPVVQRYHLERALVNFRPSLQPQESARLQNIYQQFSSDEEGGYISSDKIGILSTQHA